MKQPTKIHLETPNPQEIMGRYGPQVSALCDRFVPPDHVAPLCLRDAWTNAGLTLTIFCGDCTGKATPETTL